MQHVGEEGASGRSRMSAGSDAAVGRAAQQLAVRGAVLAVRKRVDERIDDARCPGQNRSQNVKYGHFGGVLRPIKIY